MKRSRMFWLVLLVTVTVMPDTHTAGQDGTVRMPADGMSIRIQFGLKDRQPSTWNGEIRLSTGEVVAMEVSPTQTGSAADGAWQLRTLPQAKPARKSVHDPKLSRLVQPVLTVSVDAPPTAKATVKTEQVPRLPCERVTSCNRSNRGRRSTRSAAASA